MKRQEFLSQLHRAYEPRSYLEIGTAAGRSLSLSRTRTIAVDPAFKITSEIRCDVELIRATSDDFFAGDGKLAHFPGGRIDLAFVDGLHLFEFALRDFMNVERHAHWASVIAVDDVLPRNVREPSRNRDGMVAWTGDVFKLVVVLRRYRPDLLLLLVDTEPTGVLIVLGADPENRVLADRYEQIVAEHVYPDPQRVPNSVLRREGAVEPAAVVRSGLWTTLREARDSGLDRDESWGRVARAAGAIAPARVREVTPEQLRPRSAAKTGRPAPGSKRKLAAIRRRLRPVRRRLVEARAAFRDR
jgi:hypothetical protein